MSKKLTYLALIGSTSAWDFNPFGDIQNTISDKINDAGKWVDDRGKDIDDATNWVNDKKNDAGNWVNDSIDSVQNTVGDHINKVQKVADTVKNQVKKVNLMEDKLDPLTWADVVFTKTLCQIIFEHIYNKPE